MPRALGVIPARYGSTRFPGKPLAPLTNKTLIEAVWRRASAAATLDRVVIATEDTRVLDAAASFGAEAMLTAPSHPSGSDRVAEVAERLGRTHEVVVNIQGDEPLITPTSLDRLVEAFEQDPSVRMATLAEPMVSIDELFDPNVVKVVTDSAGNALYFSRSPIPYHRGDTAEMRADFRAELAREPEALSAYRKHQGVYAFTRETLFAVTSMPTSALERAEGLEQLRALEAGVPIRVLASDFRSHGVDTPADLEVVETLIRQ